MDAAGLAFAAYKDVYYLARGIYRLGMSAKHYKEENHQLLVKLRTQCLYLRMFKYFFISILKRAPPEMSSEIQKVMVDQVNKIISCLGQALASYHGLVHAEDEEYRKQSESTPEALLATNLGWKWALFKRATLETAIDSFREWNDQLKYFEPMIVVSLFESLDARRALETTIKNDPHSDQEAFVPHVRILRLLAENTAVPTVPANLHMPPGGSPPTEVPPRTRMETKSYLQAGAEDTKAKDALRQLAALLVAAGEHDLQTLPLKSYVDNPDGHHFVFSFGFPEGASDKVPVSLWTILSEKSPAPSLPLRFHIALTISRAIAAFHADGWLHKEISSSSILFFFDKDDRCMYLRPYLVNFDYSRPDTAETNMTADDGLARNVYRHPHRQGSRPNVRFNKTHDLYALGVVLLEIGVWRTALSMRNARMKHEGITSSRTIGPMREIFEAETSQRLAHTMGPAYQKAVRCCLDGTFEDFLRRDSIFALKFQSKVVKNVDPDRVRQVKEEVD
ncbi:hypothetical protein CSOJ01_14756 [Colletotrichum sojae]|uniref:Protein kinase domain-containing protein n=1 Tax=Colletotrichum sojae TaxID=2175907 RepID=A0A8H6MIY9_9PEZI|nr:hypothetical protein CSOJ01_14756 [Colletotrichum sojae]